jgi:hypothetical protein
MSDTKISSAGKLERWVFAVLSSAVVLFCIACAVDLVTIRSWTGASGECVLGLLTALRGWRWFVEP